MRSFARKSWGMLAGFIRPNPHNKMRHRFPSTSRWGRRKSATWRSAYMKGSSLNSDQTFVSTLRRPRRSAIISHTIGDDARRHDVIRAASVEVIEAAHRFLEIWRRLDRRPASIGGPPFNEQGFNDSG